MNDVMFYNHSNVKVNRGVLGMILVIVRLQTPGIFLKSENMVRINSETILFEIVFLLNFT